MSALLTHIQRTKWQFFVTCTYANSRTMSEKVRRSMQFQWLRRLAVMDSGARNPSLAWDSLYWVIREEFGEATNRLHWHALCGGLPQGIARPSTCMFMMGYWEGIGGGMSRVRVYDDGQDGSSYITKGLESLEMLEGANRYEVGKFGTLDDSLMLIPSKSLLAKWKALCVESGGLRLAQARRKSAR